MYRLAWPDAWVANASRIGWALLVVSVLALGVGWYSFLLFVPIAGTATCFLLARRMRNTPMMAVESGELLCHISTGGGSSGGGGQLFRTYGYLLTDIDQVEERLFPWTKGRSRSKFVLKMRKDRDSSVSRILGRGEVWLIPQPVDEGMRDAMREFLKRHVPGGVAERLMEEAPSKSSG